MEFIRYRTAMASVDLKEELTCPICLNLFTDPATLKCGHNYCQECIEAVLDTQERSAAFTCPQCRTEFQERPVLQRNTTLCNIAEHVLSQEEQEEGEVFCTYCVHTPVLATKTCLLCEASLCDLHLTVHSKSPEHALIQPTKSFKNSKCSLHKKVLLYYCAEDAECLCVSCCLGEKHRGHKVELLNEAFKQEKEKLRIIRDCIFEESKKIEERVRCLQDHLRNISEKAASILVRIGIQFRDFRTKLDNLETQVVNEIFKQQEQVSLTVSDLIQQLESKQDSLSRNICTIKELCEMTYPLLYLQADREDFAHVVDDDRNLKTIEPDDLAEDVISQTLISGMLNIMSSLQKGYYVQEASGILLDENTASNDVHISDDLKMASWKSGTLGRPETPDRFEKDIVLGKEGFSDGRLYWDVEVSKEGGWRVGMTYASIGRKGNDSLIGNNNKSWGLRRFENQYSVRHDRKEIPLVYRPTCYKVRIYLDYMAGQLSFYELDDSMRHLYTYNATFTEALYPVIVVWSNAWGRVLS
ncbi:nuclear factor 7, brain-like [Bufo bufo]|uniref:nuclear factor 7, brain-like n=1 Tax=Bufo bufo TaxID=8384 RepID=UPI001ABEB4E7|nr:nuclear factor 7, brain-like [Bufo bufo]